MMKNNDRNEPSGHLSSWRDFFKTTGQVVAASALMILLLNGLMLPLSFNLMYVMPEVLQS